MGFVGAYGSDLGPAGGVDPFAGHRDQFTVVPDAEIAARLDGMRFG
jgi:hypothetical protein